MTVHNSFLSQVYFILGDSSMNREANQIIRSLALKLKYKRSFCSLTQEGNKKVYEVQLKSAETRLKRFTDTVGKRHVVKTYESNKTVKRFDLCKRLTNVV